MGQFSAALPSFTNSSTRVRERRQKTFYAFISTQTSVRTYGVCAVLNSSANFDNVSTAKLP